MKTFKRKNSGSVLVEAGLAIPVFLLLIFGMLELARMLYIKNAINTAAQQVANQISIKTKRSSTYNIGDFASYSNGIRYPGAVVNSSQFSFDVRDSNNGSTVNNGQANGATSTKVVVNVVFPPPDDPTLRIPIVDPGRIFGTPIFGMSGFTLTAQAVCFLERSRRPVLN